MRVNELEFRKTAQLSATATQRPYLIWLQVPGRMWHRLPYRTNSNDYSDISPLCSHCSDYCCSVLKKNNNNSNSSNNQNFVPQERKMNDAYVIWLGWSEAMEVNTEWSGNSRQPLGGTILLCVFFSAQTVSAADLNAERLLIRWLWRTALITMSTCSSQVHSRSHRSLFVDVAVDINVN